RNQRARSAKTGQRRAPGKAFRGENPTRGGTRAAGTAVARVRRERRSREAQRADAPRFGGGATKSSAGNPGGHRRSRAGVGRTVAGAGGKEIPPRRARTVAGGTRGIQRRN